MKLVVSKRYRLKKDWLLMSRIWVQDNYFLEWIWWNSGVDNVRKQLVGLFIVWRLDATKKWERLFSNAKDIDRKSTIFETEEVVMRIVRAMEMRYRIWKLYLIKCETKFVGGNFENVSDLYLSGDLYVKKTHFVFQKLNTSLTTYAQTPSLKRKMSRCW